MTKLSLDARNFLAQDTALRALLGRSASWDTWIFSDKPVGVKVEGTQKCLIVINENGGHAAPNEHNTMRFPLMIVDVWADPTRNADGSVKQDDAKDKIEVIFARLKKHFHTVHLSRPNGLPYIWGTDAQITQKTGSIVLGSIQLDEPDYSPVLDGNGAWMGRVRYGVNTY